MNFEGVAISKSKNSVGDRRNKFSNRYKNHTKPRKRDSFKNIFKWHKRHNKTVDIGIIKTEDNVNSLSNNVYSRSRFHQENKANSLEKNAIFKEISNRKRANFHKKFYNYDNKSKINNCEVENFNFFSRGRLKIFANKYFVNQCMNQQENNFVERTQDEYNSFFDNSLFQPEVLLQNKNHNYFEKSNKNYICPSDKTTDLNGNYHIDKFILPNNKENVFLFKNSASIDKKTDTFNLSDIPPSFRISPFSPFVEKKPKMTRSLQTMTFSDEEEEKNVTEGTRNKKDGLDSPTPKLQEQESQNKKVESAVFTLSNECVPITIPNKEENVKYLVIPTFREKQCLSLNDYISGYYNGTFSQLDIIEQIKDNSPWEQKIKNNSKALFSCFDFRNPLFFTAELNVNENANSECDAGDSFTQSEFYNITEDVQTIKNSIRSLGFKTQTDSSKIKFNLASEVFYYNEGEKSKTSQIFSLLDLSKDPCKKPVSSIQNNTKDFGSIVKNACCNNLVWFKKPSFNFLPIDSNTDNEAASSTKNKLEKENKNLIISNKHDTEIYNNIEKTFKLTEDSSVYSKNNSNSNDKDLPMSKLDFDGCLADIESLGSTECSKINLIPAELKEKELFLCNKNKVIEKTNNKNKDLFVKSILKQKNNRNEQMERQISQIEVSEQVETFLQKVEEKEDMRVKLEPLLAKERASQLQKFYSKDFYPEMEDDEEFLKSMRATQEQMGFNISNQEPLVF